MHIIWPQYFQILSLLLAIACCKGLSKFRLWGLIPLLTIVCITEFIGANRIYFGWKNNYLLYNCYLVLTFPIIMYIFFRMLQYRGKAKKIFWGAILLTFFFLLSLFFEEGPYNFNEHILIVTEFASVILPLLVLIMLFKEDDFSIMLYNHPYFWISGATMIFSISTLVILGLKEYIKSHNAQIDGQILYKVLIPMLNIVLYVSYSYACWLCYKIASKLPRQ